MNGAALGNGPSRRGPAPAAKTGPMEVEERFESWKRWLSCALTASWAAVRRHRPLDLWRGKHRLRVRRFLVAATLHRVGALPAEHPERRQQFEDDLALGEHPI